MLKGGILNPALNSLLSRVRHTNTFVIADRGFPCWPMLETIDLALVDDLPGVLDVLMAVKPVFVIGHVTMAEEFLKHNTPATQARFQYALEGLSVTYEPHVNFKKRVPLAIGLVRTGETIQYANMIIESA